MQEKAIQSLIHADFRHLWHPFTPMRQWRKAAPLIIERAEGCRLIDIQGRSYIDGVSSLWCNIHGHRVEKIDQAIRDQLGKVAHSTLLGLSHAPAIRLAHRLSGLAPGNLEQVFFSDAGATATEAAFKMAVGHWFHRGQSQRNLFIALHGAYHGDTVGAMSVGYSDLFHRPFEKLVFRTAFIMPGVPQPAATASGIPDTPRRWSLENSESCQQVLTQSLTRLDARLAELGDRVAAVAVEPLVQGAAGMVMHAPGFLAGVADLCRKHGTLLIADEVATGFGRTGRLFACEHEKVEPDILCLGKGLSGGYLPIAATLCKKFIAESFEGELHEFRTLYHGHTFTGNPLGCAAAMASLDLFEENDLLNRVNTKAALLAQALDPLRSAKDFPLVTDLRQRGLMVGIELQNHSPAGPPEQAGDFGETRTPDVRRIGHEICLACRDKGLLIRPLGDVLVLMPPLAIPDQELQQMAAVVIETIAEASRHPS